MTRVHLIGIGGSGMSAIARYLIEDGYMVSGSDRQVTPFVESLRTEGALVFVGHRPENVVGADVVVRSSAIPDDNVEVASAQHIGIPVLKRADYLGQIMKDRFGIAVAGTHGKTTTTAMISWMLTALGQDPAYIIGGTASNLGTNAHAGKGSAFVIEADEYDRMFLGLHPKIAIVTNVEHDHPDCFPSFRDFYAAFLDFVNRLEADGILLTCIDDPGALQLFQDAAAKGIRGFTYGLEPRSEPLALDFVAKDLHLNQQGGYTFEAYRSDSYLAQVSLKVPGMHNVRNALAALAVSDLLGLDTSKAAETLGEFSGTARRFEILGEVDGITIIDDYAHHPTEIRATLAAARARFPISALWVVWQPHTYSRTQTLFKEFAAAFKDADHVLVTEVYAAREPVRPDFSAIQVVQAMGHPDAHFISDFEQAIVYLLNQLQPGDVLLVLSAGDAGQIGSEVLNRLTPADPPAELQSLIDEFGERMKFNVPLARISAARVGGPADGFISVASAEELVEVVTRLWEMEVPFVVLGGGSNILVSDEGYRGVVVHNRARRIRFETRTDPPKVWAESGANLGALARQAATKGFSGLEWAAGIPGSVGGAVVGNAGAQGGDMAGSLVLAEILHRETTGSRSGKMRQLEARIIRENWQVERLGYDYRSSLIKLSARGEEAFRSVRQPQTIVLSATLRLECSQAEVVKAKIEEYVNYRRRTQPPGASMGSMFKNPPGDYAGRLIEAAGLKGTRIGNAEISPLHANFFINHGSASAADIWGLIQLARDEVAAKFGVALELEIELLGNWIVE